MATVTLYARFAEGSVTGVDGLPYAIRHGVVNVPQSCVPALEAAGFVQAPISEQAGLVPAVEEASSEGGGAAAFTDLTDAPNMLSPLKQLQTDLTGEQIVQVTPLPPLFFAGASGSQTLPASTILSGVINVVSSNNGNADETFTMPSAAALQAYAPWLFESAAYQQFGEVGVLLRFINKNVGAGNITLVGSDDVTLYQATDTIAPGVVRDYLLMAVNNSPDPVTFYLTDAGAMTI